MVGKTGNRTKSILFLKMALKWKFQPYSLERKNMIEKNKNKPYIENYLKLDKKLFEDKRLTSSDIIILSYIRNLSNIEGYCWATNEKISELTNISKATVKRSIAKLTSLKYLTKWEIRKKGKRLRFLTPITISKMENQEENTITELMNKSINFIDYDWLNEE